MVYYSAYTMLIKTKRHYSYVVLHLSCFCPQTAPVCQDCNQDLHGGTLTLRFPKIIAQILAYSSANQNQELTALCYTPWHCLKGIHVTSACRTNVQCPMAEGH